MDLPHLILLHGALGSASQFDAIVSRLGDHFQCHVPTFSGHGGLPLPEQGFSTELFRNDLLHYMDRENIGRAFLFGYSMGGFVALSFASHFPQRVRAVMTLATKFDWNPESAARETAFLVPGQMEKKVPAFTEQLERRHYPTDWRKVVNETSAYMIWLGNHIPIKEEFGSVECPVLLTVGDKDKMVSEVSTRQTADSLPNATLLLLPDTPHPLEGCRPELLVAEIRKFFT